MNLNRFMGCAIVCATIACGRTEERARAQEQIDAATSDRSAIPNRPVVLQSGLAALRTQLTQLGVPFHAGTVGDSRAILHGTTEDTGTTVTLIGESDALQCARVVVDLRASKQSLALSTAIENALMTGLGWKTGSAWANGFIEGKKLPVDQSINGVHWAGSLVVGVLELSATPESQGDKDCKP